MEDDYKTIIVFLIVFYFVLFLVSYWFDERITNLEEEFDQRFLECTELLSENSERLSENSERLDYLEALVQEPKITEEQLKEETYDEMATRIALSYGLDPYLVRSVIWSESGWDISAVNYNGSCVGLMQVSTYWNKDRAAKLGVTDFFDPESNIRLGCDILNEFINEKGYTPELALMLYNMNHDKAFALYKKGQVSSYAQTVLRNADTLRTGGECFDSAKEGTK